MPRFRYQALDKHELVAGEIEADGVQQALVELDIRGLAVQSISIISSDASPSESTIAVGGPSVAAVRTAAPDVLLREAMAAVIERGREIVPALRALAADQASGRQKSDLLSVARVLERGSVDEAVRSLGELPDYFLPLVSSTVVSNDPSRLLEGFLREARRAGELRARWWKAIAYPVIVICLALLVVAVFSVTVLPAFQDIFFGFGMQLPRITVWVMNLPRWRDPLIVVLAILSLLLLASLFGRSRRMIAAVFGDSIASRLGLTPGRYLTNARLAAFSADLVQAGVDPATALLLGSHVIRGRRGAYTPAARRRNDVLAAEGPAWSGVLAGASALTYAAHADVPASSRTQLMQAVGRCYADRAQYGRSAAHGFLAPMAVFTVGVVVGLIAIALFLPLVSLVNNLSG